jgi:hypothetical protein
VFVHVEAAPLVSSSQVPSVLQIWPAVQSEPSFVHSHALVFAVNPSLFVHISMSGQ